MAPTVLHHKLPLTKACHHYDDISSVPWDIQKYWHQRYSLFQFYDSGIHLTDDAWFGVTPEPVAAQIAKDMEPKTSTLIDMFAGAGGNTIAFALTDKWQRVIAIEKDADTLACAQHNAAVYGVLDSITWVHGDSFEVLALLRTGDPDGVLDPVLANVDVGDATVFASPPWGGVSYRNHDVFDLSRMQPYNLKQLHGACRPMAHVLFLPRTSDLRQIAKLVAEGEKMDVVQYCMEGASKAMVAYIPATKSLQS